MTLLLVPLYTLAAIGLACVVQRVLDAAKRTKADESNVVELRPSNVKVLPRKWGA